MVINIDCLSKFNFYNLNLLSLQNNRIKNIDILDKCNFKEKLIALYIYDNLIDKNSEHNIKLIEKFKNKNKNIINFKW